MFARVEYANQVWVNAQLAATDDVFLLAANLNPRLRPDIERLSDKLYALDSTTRFAICKDHTFCKWLTELKTAVVDAYDNGGATLQNTERFAVLLTMLELAVSVSAGIKFSFMLRAEMESTIMLPGSRYLLELPAIAAQDEIACRYLPRSGGIEMGVRQLPFSSFERVDSISVVDQAFSLFAAPTGDSYAFAIDDGIDVAKWVATLREALALIHLDDISREVVNNFVSFLVPLRQDGDTRNISFSVRNLPGVVFKNNEMTPYVIGETLVHEADHQFFYAVERFERFWESDIRLQEPVFYSPWRDDPRPLDGILRGLSAFARVSAYYSTLLARDQLAASDFDNVGRLLLTRLEESDIAYSTITGTGQLTAFGRQYLSEVREVLDHSRHSASNLGHYQRWKEQAQKTVNTHRAEWGRRQTNRLAAPASGRVTELDWAGRRAMFDSLTEIDSSLPSVVEATLEEVVRYEPSLSECWQRDGLSHKVTTHLLYYVIPFYELLRNEGKVNVTQALAAQLLSCMAWRTFDNCVDEHEPPKTAHLGSLAACIQLIGYCHSALRQDPSKKVLRHYAVMSKQANLEMEKPIEVEDIWKRCSIFLYAPENISDLSDAGIELYKKHLNYHGLAHDMADILSDRATGVLSLPVCWLREISPNGVLNEDAVAALHVRARSAVKRIDETLESRSVKSRLPVMNRLLQDARRVIHDGAST